MNILCISYDGATEPIPQSQVLSYLRQIDKKGMQFFWLSFEKKKSTLRSAREREVFKKELIRNNIRWSGLSYHKRPYILAKIFDILCGVFYASYLVIRYKIKIVHGRGEVSSFIGYILKRIFKLKFIYDRRGYMAEDYVEGGMWRSREGLFYRLLNGIDQTLLKSCDSVVVLTERIRRILIEADEELAKKIHTIPCCVDLQRFRYDNKNTSDLRDQLKLNEKFIFVYPGSLGTWYMLDEMIDFFKYSKVKIANAHFLILTMSDHRIAKEAIARKGQQLADFTILNIPFSEIHSYICLADIALIFIKPIFSKLSSSPTKFAECLACGLPVVINSNIGDCDGLVKTNRIGSIVEGFNPEPYKNSFDELTRLLEKKQELRQRCRKAAEEYYSLDEGAARYSSIYSKLLNNTDGLKQ
jgi:glycosyltransferase involved in cell wall biosynthesis